MAAVAMAALMLQRPAAPSRILALALLVVLIFDPGAPLRVGFWLSFGAVAAILYSVSGRWRERRWLGQTVGLQTQYHPGDAAADAGVLPAVSPAVAAGEPDRHSLGRLHGVAAEPAGGAGWNRSAPRVQPARWNWRR